ncbi:hypothetical protein CHU98_g9450 [Xylaria longipes]|nr:hypothetical protein CHU98_g9450 [Xylaria longipes]
MSLVPYGRTCVPHLRLSWYDHRDLRRANAMGIESDANLRADVFYAALRLNGPRCCVDATKALLLALFAVTVASAASVNMPRQNQNDNNNSNGNNNNQNQDNNDNDNAAAVDNAAADFGTCTPTMDFQLGRPGRKADEGTFLPTDPVVAEGQQDALNPSIIMNRICDQLTNVCDANDAAVAACEAAQASTEALGTKDASTADAFNAALGF